MARKIKVEHMNACNGGDAFLRLTLGKHVEYIFGAKSSATASTASIACKNKALAKCFMAESGLSVSPGALFSPADTEAIERFIGKIGFPCVLKKNDGTHGNKVFIGVRSLDECREILERHFGDEKRVLVEKECRGREYRFLATKKKVLGVVSREPANVTGDGQSTVRELIGAKNLGKLRIYNIKLDAAVDAYLGEQGLDLESVIVRDAKIYLRNNSNASTGGDTVDHTDEAHKEFKKIAVEAVNAVPGLAWGGVDILVDQDLSKRPVKKKYAILEINSNPGLYIHNSPDRGKPRNVAAGIVDVLFPETKK